MVECTVSFHSLYKILVAGKSSYISYQLSQIQSGATSVHSKLENDHEKEKKTNLSLHLVKRFSRDFYNLIARLIFFLEQNNQFLPEKTTQVPFLADLRAENPSH